MNSNQYASFPILSHHPFLTGAPGRRMPWSCLAAVALLLTPALPWADHHGGSAPTQTQITEALADAPNAEHRSLYQTALVHPEFSAEQQLEAAKRLAAIDGTTGVRAIAIAALHAQPSHSPKNGWTDLLIRASESDTALADELAWLAMLSDDHRPAAVAALASRTLDDWLPQISPALRVTLGEAALRAAGDAEGANRSRLQAFAKTALTGLPAEQAGHLLAQINGSSTQPPTATPATKATPAATQPNPTPSPTPAPAPTPVSTGDPLDSPELIAKGKTLFQTKTCFTCHTVDPAKPAVAGIAFGAPAFTGKFWGQERKVRKGSLSGPIETVVIDQEYFIESIKQPMLKISDGAKSPMIFAFPTSDDEITALAAYVKSLSE